MARLIGTAGHVDHGKTSLIRALTGIDADRLPEEKVRGLTIDIGFAYIDIPGIGQVSIVDVPGHERFLSNMLVGALGVDVAILCVAADESVKPQTLEHLQILDLLPVRKLIVAVTRTDLVDTETLAVTTSEIHEALASTRFNQSEIIPVSSVTGFGLEKLKSALAACLEATEQHNGQPWYLPVDRVFTVKGHGAIVTGTMMRGIVKVGDEVALEPGGMKAKIRQIQGHDQTKDMALSGQRTALNLSGVKAEELRRGLLAGRPGTIFSTALIEAQMRWVSDPKHAQRVRISIGADEVIGKVLMRRGSSTTVQFKLERPTAATSGQSVIVRNYSPPQVLGGGKVTIPLAEPRKKIESSVDIDPSNPLKAIPALLRAADHGLATDEICKFLGRTQQALGDIFERLIDEGSALGFAGLWFDPGKFEELVEKFIETLEAAHVENQGQSLFPKEGVAKRAQTGWSGKPLDRILNELLSRGKIRQNGSMIGLVGRVAEMNPAQRALLERVKGTLAAAGMSVPNPAEIALQLGVPSQAVSAILKLGLDAGELVRVDEAIWYPQATLDNIEAEARSKFKSDPFTASEFRDAFGSSRKYVIPILEHFDARRKTFRRNDARVFN